MSASALYDVIMQVELSKEVIEVAQATSIAVVILLVLLYAQVTTTKCVSPKQKHPVLFTPHMLFMLAILVCGIPLFWLYHTVMTSTPQQLAQWTNNSVGLINQFL
eukprot:m.21266 g.21266  ORF g.21266 m.21266 type:complete len:105 (-) comp8268_c0_seq1:204-518(-)